MTFSRRKLLAALGLTAMVTLTSTGPATAHEGTPHGSITVSPAGDVIEDTSSPVVTGRFDAALEEITSVTLKVRPTGGQANPEHTADGCALATSGNCGASTLEVKWAPELAYNGPYVAEVVLGHRLLGLGESSVGEGTVPVAFRMAVPPRAPQQLRADVRPERSVSLSWARNPEPDVVGYIVERKGPEGDFKPLGGFVAQPASGARVATNDFTTAQAGGSFVYRVQAGRRGAEPNDLGKALSSKYSEVAIADVPVGTASPVTGPTSPPIPVAPPAAPGGVNRRSSGTVDLSGFLGDVTPSPRPPELATEPIPDAGFSESLPFGESEAANPDEGPAEPGESSNRRALLIPLAAGSVLCVVALQLRWLTRRLNQAEPEPWSGDDAGGDDDYFAVSDGEWEDDGDLVGAGSYPRRYEF